MLPPASKPLHLHPGHVSLQCLKPAAKLHSASLRHLNRWLVLFPEVLEVRQQRKARLPRGKRQAYA